MPKVRKETLQVAAYHVVRRAVSPRLWANVRARAAILAGIESDPQFIADIQQLLDTQERFEKEDQETGEVEKKVTGDKIRDIARERFAHFWKEEYPREIKESIKQDRETLNLVADLLDDPNDKEVLDNLLGL